MLGLVIAWLLVRVRRRIDEPALEITISLATPYLVYTAAQAAHLTGVLATVVAGVYTGSHLSGIYAPAARLRAFAFLDLLVFLLNAVLFTLLGMSLVRKVHLVPGQSFLHLLVIMSATVAVVIAVRLIWTMVGPTVVKLFGRTLTTGDWRERVILGWAGMRGGVSLTAALAIPLKRADGAPFPDRKLVILVAAAVIVATLLMQGVSLPWLLRRLRLRAADFHTEENEVRLEATHAASQWLDENSECEGTDAATESVRTLYEARLRRLQTTPDEEGAGSSTQATPEMERYKLLRLQLLEVERSVLLGLRSEGRITATLLRNLERDIDLVEARLTGS